MALLELSLHFENSIDRFAYVSCLMLDLTKVLMWLHVTKATFKLYHKDVRVLVDMWVFKWTLAQKKARRWI